MLAELIASATKLQMFLTDTTPESQKRVDAVLQHIRSVTLKGAILRPSLVPAKKTLPDGRNAHLILESPGWWQGKVSKYFNVISIDSHMNKSNILVAINLICTPKPA